MRYLNLTFNIALLLFSALLSACATPASRSFETAEKLETEGRYEEAMYGYAESFKSDPTLNESRIGFLKARQKAADQRYDQGMGLVAQGNYVDALTEFQAAQKLTDAAQIMGGSPAAIQLRYLQTLTEISTEKNSTIIFPVPMDLIRMFMESRKPQA